MKKVALIFLSLTIVMVHIFGITKNLIYLIPAGMGFSHLTLMKYTSIRLPSLFMFEDLGFLTTNSANSYVTDKAAAGTALATGFETLNGFMGLDSLGRPVDNMFESAMIQGKSIGLITDSKLLDPLVMSFYAHTKSLNEPQDELMHFLESSPDIVFGKLNDDILSTMKPKLSSSFTLIRSKDELLRIEPWKIKKLLGFFPKESDYSITSEIIDKSFEILRRNPEGFVLIIVFDGIEKSSLENNTSSLLDNLKQLDMIVRKVLAFCHDNRDTLLVIASPYEVGAPYLTSTFDLKSVMGVGDSQKIEGINWTSNAIISSITFVLSYGPGSEKFRGFHRLSQIPLLIADTMKLNLPSVFEVIN